MEHHPRLVALEVSEIFNVTNLMHHNFFVVFLNMHSFCHPEEVHRNMTDDFKKQLTTMKAYFVYAQIAFCIIGILGNVLNLRTLQSPSLQTVPFMYIRALAVFDLISLAAILTHFAIANFDHNYWTMAYMTYVEAVLINTFLVAGLYCAFMLTVERYMLINHPHEKGDRHPRRNTMIRIFIALAVAFVFHVPMMLQTKLKKTYDTQNGTLVFSTRNNVELLCKEPYWSIFNYYKITREGSRFLCVLIMIAMNAIIARKLQLTKMRRRRLVRRSSPSDSNLNQAQCRDETQLMSSPERLRNGTSGRRPIDAVVRSFAEKKLTGLMVAICLIFVLGNVPQIIVMILQNESMDNEFGFQVYRNVANLLEVVNHCLNFYVFCMASKDYTRAFLHNCFCIQPFLQRIPAVADFMAARRSISVVSNPNSGLTLQNRTYYSVDSLAETEANIQWCDIPNACIGDNSPLAGSMDGRLRGILVSSDRNRRNDRRSLTIVNHLAIPAGLDFDEQEDSSEL